MSNFAQVVGHRGGGAGARVAAVAAGGPLVVVVVVGDGLLLLRGQGQGRGGGAGHGHGGLGQRAAGGQRVVGRGRDRGQRLALLEAAHDVRGEVGARN